MKSAAEWTDVLHDEECPHGVRDHDYSRMRECRDCTRAVIARAIAEARREAMAAVCPACAAGIEARLSDQGRWVHMPFEGRDECDSHAIRALATEPEDEEA